MSGVSRPKPMAGVVALKKLWGLAGERKPLLAFTLCIGFLDMVVDSLGLSLSLKAASNAALSGSIDAVYRAGLMLTGVVVFRSTFAALGRYLTAKITEDVALGLRMKVFRAVMGAKTEYLDTHESGDLISRLSNDIETAKMGISGLVNGVKQLYLIVLATVGLLVWSWPFAIGLFVMAGLSFAGGAATSRPLRVTSQRYQETLAGVSESATNLFGGIAVVKSLRAESEMQSRFGLVIDEHQAAAKRRGLFMALQSGTVMAVPFLGLGAMMVLSGSMTFRGILTPGDAIALVQLSSRSLFPFSQLGGIWAGLQQNLAALGRVEEACGIPQERSTPQAQVTRLDGASAGTAPSIEFRDVHFAYGDKAVLKGLSFSVDGGESAALIGPSGSGKSTVLRLLLGMYEPREGAISIGGKSVSDMSLRDLRNMIAVVPQEPWLIPGTIKENILLGKPDASDEEVAAAALAANAVEFIESLPDGYDTVLDERGGNLSGGQRQRICLARAFLKDAPVLLLDEPTSAVDAESERLIRQAVDRLTEGRTVITVAHTKAMVENAGVTVALG